MSARSSSVKLIGMPTKMANSITTSITTPSSSRNVIPRSSYLHFLAVLELAAEADLVAALQRFRHSLDHEEHRGAERPHHRSPRRLLGELVDAEGVPGVVHADDHQRDQRRIEQQHVGD